LTEKNGALLWNGKPICTGCTTAPADTKLSYAATKIILHSGAAPGEPKPGKLSYQDAKTILCSSAAPGETKPGELSYKDTQTILCSGARPDQGDVDVALDALGQRVTVLEKRVPAVDNKLSSTSKNPVQNKVVTEALAGKVNTAPGAALMTSAQANKLAGIEAGAQKNLPADATPTKNSKNSVSSGGVFTALDGLASATVAAAAFSVIRSQIGVLEFTPSSFVLTSEILSVAQGRIVRVHRDAVNPITVRQADPIYPLYTGPVYLNPYAEFPLWGEKKFNAILSSGSGMRLEGQLCIGGGYAWIGSATPSPSYMGTVCYIVVTNGPMTVFFPDGQMKYCPGAGTHVVGIGGVMMLTFTITEPFNAGDPAFFNTNAFLRKPATTFTIPALQAGYYSVETTGLRDLNSGILVGGV
jgi:hypothetical protein